jgi:long-subunit acyl-CoA synthetase (AMP-forming)
MKDDWTVDNGLLTPTLKIKRHLLEEKYDALINNPEKGKLIYQS